MSLQISVVMPNMKVEINNQIMFFYKNKQAIEDLVHLLFFPKNPERIFETMSPWATEKAV